MTLSPDIAMVLALLAPFAAALLAPWISRLRDPFAGLILALAPVIMLVLHLTYLPMVARGETLRVAFDWLPRAGIALSFFVDGLALTFALTIAGIGALIVVYAATYLHGHAQRGRFLAVLLAFMGAMQGLVLADNMVVLFVFWELTSVTSFLLIGFDHARQAARRAAIQAVVVTGGGGLLLLAGLVLLYGATGTWDLSAIRAARPEFGPLLYTAILTLVLAGAFTKSAQFPFHFWLPNAMEAPTPVSAYLHSATMVQAGVYLLARINPTLGGTGAWTFVLTLVGGITLIWGALGALRQADLKQMLAQTTLASLGLSVMLLGMGGEAVILGLALYFVTHALYKAGLFLVAGIIDHETGTRDITALGGLREPMAATFIAAALAALGMLGLPPALGFLAKEEIYAGATDAWLEVLPLIVLVVGNGLLGAVALAVLIKPFFGPTLPTPKSPREGPVTMLAGPVLLGIAGIGAGIAVGPLAHDLLAPMAGAVLDASVKGHVGWAFNATSPAFLLSLLTWAIAGIGFWQADRLRSLLRRPLFTRLSLDAGFDAAMFGLIRWAGGMTRGWHHGRLELYLFVVFVMLALALLVPVLIGGLPPLLPAGWPTLYEWPVIVLAAAGSIAVLTARTRLTAVVSLGVQGLAVALLYLLFGAPDLAFTQLMVEVLSVVILALVMTRLALEKRDTREFQDLARDGVVALACGIGAMLTLAVVTSGTLPDTLSRFFTENSVGLAHGHNIVNVILVDFRGLDTLGEITVVMTAGIAILALLRRPARRKAEAAQAPPAKPKRARRTAA